VIPTRNRPDLVPRAVRSALAQTYDNIEVVVIVDGPDPATEAALSGIADARLRVLTLPQPMGGSNARNAGARAARGEWVAFLDDDDEWLATKTEAQLAIALEAACEFPIVSCRQFVQTPRERSVMPRRLPRDNEPISEYLFARSGPFHGEGALTTITILTRRELLLKVPFRPEQRRHQEWDWLLRAAQLEHCHVLFSPEVLAVWNAEQARVGVSSADDWRDSFEWIQSIRPLVTPRAYAAFLLTVVSAIAARGGNWRACMRVLKEAFRHGAPAAIDVTLFAGMVLIPQRHRRQLRAALTRHRS
jgi:glycosyltransferase involved in cell wall biosynthesis